jgi:hypothetical protein
MARDAGAFGPFWLARAMPHGGGGDSLVIRRCVRCAPQSEERVLEILESLWVAGRDSWK